MIENKETISFDEFRAWMTGLIVGKRGALPDLDDWKMIKKMMDKVVPEKEIITLPATSEPKDRFPYNPTPYNPTWVPNTGDSPYNPTWVPYFPNGNTWCGSTDRAVAYGDITVASGSTTPIEQSYTITNQSVEEFGAAIEMMLASNQK